MKKEYFKNPIFWETLTIIGALSYVFYLVGKSIIPNLSLSKGYLILLDFVSVFALLVILLSKWISQQKRELIGYLFLVLCVVIAIPINSFVYWIIFKAFHLSNLNQLNEYFGDTALLVFGCAVIYNFLSKKKPVKAVVDN